MLHSRGVKKIGHAGRVLVLTTAVLALVAHPSGARTASVRVAIRSRSLQPGELIVVTISAAPDVTAVMVRALDRATPAFRVAPGRWRALVGIDLDQAPGRSTLTVEARSGGRVDSAAEPLVIRPRQFPTRRLTVDPDFVNPPPDVQARIERESALLAEVFAHPADLPLWEPPFVRPVPGPANSRFGTRSVFNGEPRSAHGGADFLSAAGTPIKAPNSGRVVLARSLFFSGNTVVIDHGAGVFSLLAHMSRIDVAEGQEIRRGQTVGLVGATGRVTGPHLHWALRVGGARVDPTAALALLGNGRS